MNIEILVNKNNPINSDFIPKNLFFTNKKAGNYLDPEYQPCIVRDVYDHFVDMAKDALSYDYHIFIGSGYRSYDYQQKILDKNIELKGEEAYKTVALPGTSEHQTGLAFDVALFRNGEYVEDFSDSDLEIIWLHKNSYKYGFILRYPMGKEFITGYSYEPWHFRYVGIKLAKFLFEKDITLEEYYDNVKSTQ